MIGFPFGGITSFGAMASHIPDGGSCLVVFGPHVGVDSTGKVGTVERRGRANGGACCGSAVAASGYAAGVHSGETSKYGPPTTPDDAQQNFVGTMLLPYAEQLDEAADTMVDLPYALYDAQKKLMDTIVQAGAGNVAGDGKVAVLGGIQVNTPAGMSDYFLPLSFEVYNNDGSMAKNLGEKIGVGKLPFSTPMKESIATNFPKAKKNADLVSTVAEKLEKHGYGSNSLVATSLCADEVNRVLEDDFKKVYNDNFSMGGLAGFPFGGKTAFGAMASHIPDGGSCLVVFGPHVGVDSIGKVGTVERRGRANGGACCGSAVAASGYVSGVHTGQASKYGPPETAIDAQQNFVGTMLLPYAAHLEKAADKKMVDLPYALYDAQKKMVDEIVTTGAGSVADGKVAVLGGVQVNTPEGESDYFLPLSFEVYNNSGELVEDMSDAIDCGALPAGVAQKVEKKEKELVEA